MKRLEPLERARLFGWNSHRWNKMVKYLVLQADESQPKYQCGRVAFLPLFTNRLRFMDLLTTDEGTPQLETKLFPNIEYCHVITVSFRL